MSRPLKNILIIGASGNLGPSIFHALDTNPAFTVSVLSRTDSKSTYPPHITVHTVPPNYPTDALVSAFKGQDAIIDLAPLSDLSQHHRCVDAAIAAGVARYIPPEFGSNTAEPRVVDAVPVFKGKVAMRDYLVSKEEEGLTWTGVINGPFFDWGLAIGFLGFDLKNRKAKIYDDGEHYNDMTTLPTIGQAVAGILSKPDETANKYVHINSFRVTQNMVLGALEKATGGTKWEVEKVSSAEARKKGGELLAKGDFGGFVPAVIGIEFSGFEWVDFGRFGVWNEKLGLPKTNEGLEEAVKAVVDKQTGA